MEAALKTFGSAVVLLCLFRIKNALVLGNPSKGESGEETLKDQHLKKKKSIAPSTALSQVRARSLKDAIHKKNKSKATCSAKGGGKQCPGRAGPMRVLFFLEPVMI